MEILWLLGEGSVKDVWERTEPERHLAYTTVMTVLGKLRRKGIVKQGKKGKAYIYSPSIGREEALARVVEHVVRNYFKGSSADFLQYVSNGSITTRGERDFSKAFPQRSEEPPIDEFLL